MSKENEIPVLVRLGENNALVKETSIPRECGRVIIYISGEAVQQSVQPTAYGASLRTRFGYWLIRLGSRLAKIGGG